jgi:hypothetical protein
MALFRKNKNWRLEKLMNNKKLEKLHQKVVLNEDNIVVDTTKILLFKKLFNIRSLTPFQFVIVFRIVRDALRRFGIR